MADDNKLQWGMLVFIGTIAGVALGAVIALLFRERRQSQLQGGGQPINVYGGYGPANDYQPNRLLSDFPMSPTGYPSLPEAPPFLTNDNVALATRTNTFTLSTKSVRIFTAPRSGPTWRVQVRVIGPAGGFGQFSIDQPLPDGPNSNLDMGSPQGFIIPANGFNGTSEIFLGPRQTLYGKAGGTEGDVQVSYIASASV